MKPFSIPALPGFVHSQSFKRSALTVILLNLAFLVQAQNPTSPALNFNVFVKNNFTLVRGETEGSIAAGGNVTLEGSYVMASKTAGSFKVGNLPIGLLVGGLVKYGSGNQVYVNNGYVKLGNCTGSVVWYTDNNGASSNLRITNDKFNSNPSINLQTSASKLGVGSKTNPVCQGSLIDFQKSFSELQFNSKTMAAYPTVIEFTNPNGDRKGTTIPSVLTNGQVKVNLKAGTNVINVTGRELNSVNGNITFNSAPDATKTLIINVDAPGAFTWNVWNQAGLALQNSPYIIYNFYNTTNLQVEGNNTIEGTVLAPFADMVKSTNQSNIEGQVIALSLYHSGGANRYAVFNGNLVKADTDQDGVADTDDQYPNDNTKAFNILFPGVNYATLMFEDLWPYTGDYDFNDLVVDYRVNIATNASNYVAEMAFSFVPRAAGASLKNGFAFQLNNISPDKISGVKGTKMSTGWTALKSNGTEEGQKSANIIVFDNVYKIFKNLPAEGNINTFTTAPYYTADTITVVVQFSPGVLNYGELTAGQFNPYLIVDQIRGKEVHLMDQVPSAKMDQKFFGQGNDNSNPLTGRYFTTKTNLPWALNIMSSIPYTVEKVDFTKAYLNFIKWATSGGYNNADWYLDNQGNRENKNLYKH